MSEKSRKNLIKYGIAFAVSLAFAGFHCYSQDIMEAKTADVYRILSDAFTFPGMLCGFAGALAWLSAAGSLDGISYVLQYAAKSLLFMGRDGYRETYAEFVERRHAKKHGGYGFLFVTGAVCIVIGTVFTALFYQTYR